MKLVPEGELKYGRVRSEGKMLEVIPIIEDANGSPMMLPPAIWPVDNWLLGFEDHHMINTPMSFWQNVKTVIPGSSPNAPVRLTFLVRVLEAGEQPRAVGTIDADAVRELIQAVRIAPDVYRGDG